MNCEGVRDEIVLAAYGELADDRAVVLEGHLNECDECRRELSALRAMNTLMELQPLVDVDPNLLAQSRMRLDEALDAMPPHGMLTRLRFHAMSWLGHLQGAPALATLLIGLGFLGGNFTYRYQVAHAPKLAPPVILTNANGGGISAISSVRPLPNDMVQVSYDRVVPEMAEGSLDDPQIRALLMTGTKAAATNVVRADSIALLANECRIGHACRAEDDGDVRSALLVALHSDRNSSVRLKALEGLQPYVSQDERVRDGISQALLNDANASVRIKAVEMLQPVGSDTSVRQVLRTVSATDDNPYIRTVSTQALAVSSQIQ